MSLSMILSWNQSRYKNGNEVFVFKSKTLIPEDDITITSDKVRYLKKKYINFTKNFL